MSTIVFRRIRGELSTPIAPTRPHPPRLDVDPRGAQVPLRRQDLQWAVLPDGRLDLRFLVRAEGVSIPPGRVFFGLAPFGAFLPAWPLALQRLDGLAPWETRLLRLDPSLEDFLRDRVPGALQALNIHVDFLYDGRTTRIERHRHGGLRVEAGGESAACCHVGLPREAFDVDLRASRGYRIRDVGFTKYGRTTYMRFAVSRDANAPRWGEAVATITRTADGCAVPVEFPLVSSEMDGVLRA
jgi:hypothetical protein